jgi:hypothetical protein
MPNPPHTESAIEKRASVTRSIADESIGVLSVRLGVSVILVSASEGSISLRAGLMSTSSNVIVSSRAMYEYNTHFKGFKLELSRNVSVRPFLSLDSVVVQ